MSRRDRTQPFLSWLVVPRQRLRRIARESPTSGSPTSKQLAEEDKREKDECKKRKEDMRGLAARTRKYYDEVAELMRIDLGAKSSE